MREKMIEAIKSHARGHIDKHVANVEIQLNNPVGVATHPDHIETIEKELKEIARYEEQLEVISKHFEKKDPFKS